MLYNIFNYAQVGYMIFITFSSYLQVKIDLCDTFIRRNSRNEHPPKYFMNAYNYTLVNVSIEEVYYCNS